MLQTALRSSRSSHNRHYQVASAVGASVSVLAAVYGGYLYSDESSYEHQSSHHLSVPSPSVTLCEGETKYRTRPINLKSRQTVRKMEQASTKARLKSRYDVDWRQPLGVGSFGSVYLATDRTTGKKVALKKIAKKHTSNSSFQREMNALLHLQKQAGGHPNICSLIEHFDEGDHFYLILGKWAEQRGVELFLDGVSAT